MAISIHAVNAVGRMTGAAALFSLLLGLHFLSGCATPGKASTSPAPSSSASSASLPAVPEVVYDRFDSLRVDLFAGVKLGTVRLSDLESQLALHRFNRQSAQWGPTPETTFPVVVVTSARSEGTTALILSGLGEDPVVASILVRDFAGSPPPQARFQDMLPWLERFRGGFEVYDVPASAAGVPQRDRYAFLKKQGVKLGFMRTVQGTWVLDNVEFFPKEWSPQALARLKHLPTLQKAGVLREGSPFKEPSPLPPPAPTSSP